MMLISHRAKTKSLVLIGAVLMKMKKVRMRTFTVIPIRMLQKSMMKSIKVAALIATRRWRMWMERPRPSQRRSWWRGQRRRSRNECVSPRIMHCYSLTELQIQTNDIWAFMICYDLKGLKVN
jgi:hypothetical protein